MKLISTLSNIVFKIESFFVTIILSVMLTSLFLGVVFRYFLNNPLIWAEELAIFSLAWVTFIGASMGIKKNQTAAVSILIDRLRGKLKNILFGVGLLILITFFLFLIYLSVQWLSSPNISVQYSTALRIPMIYVYLSVPVSFSFMTIHSLYILLTTFQGESEADME